MGATARLRVGIALAALAGCLGLGAAHAGVPEADVARSPYPPAPTEVSAKVDARGRVHVTWRADDSTGDTRSFVVHAGPGSCPVVVPGSARTAILPIVTDRLTVTPRVQAVDDRGYSPEASSGVAVRGLPDPRYVNLQVLQLSDFHGALEGTAPSMGAARLAAAFDLDRERVQRTILLSSGDNIGGTPPISSLFDDTPTIEVMNLMGFDASTFGNHEHDRPLRHLRGIMRESEFPWTVANYSTLKPLTTGRNPVRSSLLIDSRGLRVGIVGMNTEETMTIVPAESLAFGAGRSIVIGPDTAPVNRQARALRKAGAQVVIALLHHGWSATVDGKPQGRLIDVSRQLRGVDAAYGGHTHLNYAARIGGMPVTQVPNAGVAYSRTQVCVDTRAAQVVGSSVEIVTREQVQSIAPDARVARVVERYRTLANAQLGQPVGVVSGLFASGGNPQMQRSSETALGDWIADTVRATYSTDLAFVMGGFIRDSLPASGFTPDDPDLRRPGPGSTGPYDVTTGDVLTMMSMAKTWATSEMTGAQVWQALEHGVGGYPSAGWFPQVSGLRFSFDPRQPVGSRLVAVTRLDGTPIAKDQTEYTVAVDNSSLEGAFGFGSVFNPARGVLRDPDTAPLLAALAADARRGRVTAVPELDGRIEVIGVSPRPSGADDVRPRRSSR